MKIYIGSDHRGYDLKQALVTFLKEKGYNVIDKGTHNTDSCDYPIIAKGVGEEVAKDSTSVGIVVCGSGIGVSIAANKVKNIRCALVYNLETSLLAKQHNDANVIALASDFVSVETAKTMVLNYLGASFMQNQHTRRVEQIANIEGGKYVKNI